MSRPLRVLSGIGDRLGRLPPLALALIGVLVASGFGAGGYYAYRAYDYVEHDNDFCLSCHLMVEPYESFARSAHRGLGCKACHRPTLVERSTMGLTQFVENPDTLGVHAEVPNEVCADCHIYGDPEVWELIAGSAGHRIHLESTDSALVGLACVECHSTSLHEFAAVDRTCAQSGCHEDSQVQLGAMSNLAIHCAACHTFNAPAPEASSIDELAGVLQPDEETCLTCHEMRTLVELPDPDPHERACASCHNPHEQATPEEAAASCATGECHAAADTLTPFHRGLEDDVLADCLYCHQAHDFGVEGSNCLACHTGILDDTVAVQRVAVSTFEPWAHVPRVQTRPDFLHSEHRDVDCSSCHETVSTHGALSVTTVTDCRSCHHTEPVTADGCARCHTNAGTSLDPYSATRTLAFSVGQPATRSLPFHHEAHTADDCATCHTDGLELSAADVDCTSCHEQHHALDTDCMSCHVEAPESAHPVGQAHVGCTGAGCHTDVPFDGFPVTRSACLLCHQDLVDHRPEDPDCAGCHAMTGVRGGVPNP